MDDYFLSNVTIDVIIINDKNKIIRSKSWDEDINKEFYEDTKSSKYIYLKKDFILPLGNYTCNIIINDFENHINWIKNSNFEIVKKEGIEKDISIFYKNNGDYLKFEPNSFNEKIDTIWIAYRIYEEKDSLKYELEYLDIIFKDDFILNNYDRDFFDFDIFGNNSEYNKSVVVKNIVYNYEEIINNYEVGELQYHPVPIIPDNFNILKINLIYGDVIQTKVINFIDSNDHKYDLSILIGPMYYLLNSKYYEFESLTYDDKILYIEEYWNKIDGNNLFKEFYKRVLYSNDNFSYLSLEGWDTDRGMIYIINGAPEEINYEFNDQTEYVIWKYKNRSYIFINNYGNYELYNYNKK